MAKTKTEKQWGPQDLPKLCNEYREASRAAAVAKRTMAQLREPLVRLLRKFGEAATLKTWGFQAQGFEVRLTEVGGGPELDVEKAQALIEQDYPKLRKRCFHLFDVEEFTACVAEGLVSQADLRSVMSPPGKPEPRISVVEQTKKAAGEAA